MKQPSLLKIFKLLEQMEKEGILSQWAIGGSVGVMFYTEPYLTKDIGVFVYIEPTKSGLIDMNFIYDWLKDKGYSKFKGHSIIVEDWLVDFMPAKQGLIDEAIVQCNEFKTDNIMVNVISPEYLIAMALESGRRQDYAKIEKILQQKFGLYKKWGAYG